MYFSFAVYICSLVYAFLLHKNMTQGSSGGGEGFEVTKYGHGRVALIGFPRCACHLYFLNVFDISLYLIF